MPTEPMQPEDIAAVYESLNEGADTGEPMPSAGQEAEEGTVEMLEAHMDRQREEHARIREQRQEAEDEAWLAPGEAQAKFEARMRADLPGALERIAELREGHLGHGVLWVLREAAARLRAARDATPAAPAGEHGEACEFLMRHALYLENLAAVEEDSAEYLRRAGVLREAAAALRAPAPAPEADALREALADLMNGVRLWAAQEDGLPAELAPAYRRAHALLGWSISDPADRAALNPEAR